MITVYGLIGPPSAFLQAAAASAHHKPRPIPAMPTMAANEVIQSALFMSASA